MNTFSVLGIFIKAFILLIQSSFVWFVLGVIILIKFISIKVRSGKNQKWFQSKNTISELRSLSPSEFEKYISELFTALGFRTKVVGGSHDGGIDVEAEKDGKKFYIQCKKFITQQVPVGAVRDFYGAISDKLSNAEGYFVTTNIFTLEAKKFAEGKPIELIDQFKLLEYINLAGNKVSMPETKSMSCPQCSGNLVERNGPNGKFLGCSNFPKCRYTRETS